MSFRLASIDFLNTNCRSGHFMMHDKAVLQYPDTKLLHLTMTSARDTAPLRFYFTQEVLRIIFYLPT